MRTRLKALTLMLVSVWGGDALEARQRDGAALMKRSLAATRPVSIRFTATSADFANPERGFYRPLKTDLASIDSDEVAGAFADGHRLIYARIDLEPYSRVDLPVALLKRLDAAFGTARRGGVKLIVRATYNYPRGETGYQDAQDAPLPRVLKHLTQLAPVWRRNADVIAFVQAGFVGAWGEWHASSNGLTAPAARTRIKNALLDAVPDSRFVQFRYPPYLIEWTPQPPAAVEGRSTSFRLGFHNDCFLASETDVGTYDEDVAKRRTQQGYIDRLGDVAPFGGETCNPADDPGARPRTSCDEVLQEGARYNLTYLNAAYYRKLFHDRWTKDGCMAQVRRSMGYRVELVGAAHPAVAQRGQQMKVGIVARNAGWARIYNPRAIEVLLRDRVNGRMRRLPAGGVDPRLWLPGLEKVETLRVVVPRDLPVGSYELLFAMPDADERLAGDSRYSIRFANSDDATRGQRWDAALGAFSFGSTVGIE